MKTSKTTKPKPSATDIDTEVVDILDGVTTGLADLIIQPGTNEVLKAAAREWRGQIHLAMSAVFRLQAEKANAKVELSQLAKQIELLQRRAKRKRKP